MRILFGAVRLSPANVTATLDYLKYEYNQSRKVGITHVRRVIELESMALLSAQPFSVSISLFQQGTTTIYWREHGAVQNIKAIRFLPRVLPSIRGLIAL